MLGAVQVCPIEANAPPKETKCAQDILTVIGGEGGGGGDGSFARNTMKEVFFLD